MDGNLLLLILQFLLLPKAFTDNLSKCPMEKGFCVLQDGRDQTAGVIKVNAKDGNTTQLWKECLQTCLSYKNTTGCEVIWNQENHGCYVHTQQISRGNGDNNHQCWVFAKCPVTPKPTVGKTAKTTTPALNGEIKSCTFFLGKGYGGSNVKIGNQKGYACIYGCAERRRSDHSINGITVYSDTRRGGCWCERNMKERILTSAFKTCYIVGKSSYVTIFRPKSMKKWRRIDATSITSTVIIFLAFSIFITILVARFRQVHRSSRLTQAPARMDIPAECLSPTRIVSSGPPATVVNNVNNNTVDIAENTPSESVEPSLPSYDSLHHLSQSVMPSHCTFDNPTYAASPLDELPPPSYDSIFPSDQTPPTQTNGLNNDAYASSTSPSNNSH